MLLDLLQSELALLSTEAKKKGAENVKEASFVVSLRIRFRCWIPLVVEALFGI